MDEIQVKIFQYLNEYALGSPNAKNSDTIYQHLRGQGISVMEGRTQEQIRASIKSMIEQHNLLIGSNSGFGQQNGYYIINSRDEVIHTIMNLVKRSRSMLNRVEALRSLWNNKHPSESI